MRGDIVDRTRGSLGKIRFCVVFPNEGSANILGINDSQSAAPLTWRSAMVVRADGVLHVQQGSRR